MKKFILSLAIMMSFFSFKVRAQDCPLPQANLNLSGNNISARINLAGDLFWDREENQASFHVPNSEYPFKSTIFSHGLWVAAKDANDEFKAAAAIYNSNSRYDYVAGPLGGNCENYNRLWEVYGYEIQQHISDFEDNGIINNPIPNIMAYPAHQNPFFEIIHGFELPDTPQGLAPFFDNNGDGIYNPNDGDYPKPHNLNPSVIPSHIIWGISNDGNGYNSTANSDPLNIEIQLTAWALNCTNNEQINNTLFTSYKIINRGNENMNDTRVGFFNDADIGCYTDDYFGCIPLFNTYYFYNEDPIDGDNGNSCPQNIPTYGDNPPVQAITILNHEMNSFSYYQSNTSIFTPLGRPNQPNQFYNYLNGTWRDGTPITVGGNGYDSNSSGLNETKFAFPNNPNDLNGWSMHTTNLSSFTSGRYPIAGIDMGTIAAGEQVIVDLGYTFYQDENLNHVESVDMVHFQTPVLQGHYDNQFSNVCDVNNNPCDNDCVWTGDANRDSIVTILDFLQIGVAHGETGVARNKPLLWSPFVAEDWNTTLDGVDLKHTDCYGDGIINDVDFELAELFYQYSNKTVPILDTYNQGTELSLETTNNFNLDSINLGEVGRCFLKQNQEVDLYGITFTLEYDTTYLVEDSNFGFSLTTPWNTTVPLDQFYKFQNEDFGNGEIQVCYVKTNGENTMSKDGNLGVLFFTPKPTEYAQIQTFIKLKNIKAILNDGSQIDYGANQLEVNIYNPNGTGIILNNEDFEKEKIKIFPNPTTDILNIQLEKSEAVELTIFDIYGKKVFEKNEFILKSTSLDISNLTNGIYFLQIKKEGITRIEKFIKS